MSPARKRRDVILEIVATESVGTQEELVAALARRGLEASQASVSRDIAALGLAKVDGRWARPGTPPPEEAWGARIRDNVLDLRAAGEHLAVLITPPGEASPVAIALERAGISGVVGTIAGDDTIFVALDGARGGAELRRSLRKLGVRA